MDWGGEHIDGMSNGDAMLLTGLHPAGAKPRGRVRSTPTPSGEDGWGKGWRGDFGARKSADLAPLSEQHQTSAGHNPNGRFRMKLDSVGPDREAQT
jgi:hypothetical protein